MYTERETSLQLTLAYGSNCIPLSEICSSMVSGVIKSNFPDSSQRLWSLYYLYGKTFYRQFTLEIQ